MYFLGRSGSAIVIAGRCDRAIIQLLHIPVTWEWKRDNATMKRIEARIESTMSVQLFHIPVTWENSGTQSRFHTLLAFDSFSIRSSSSLRAAIATVLRHYRSRQTAREPTLCVCFEHVQNKRQGLALEVAHGDPIALLTRHQIALRDLDLLCIALLYFRTRSGSAIMIVGKCDWNSFLSWFTDSCRKLKSDWWGRSMAHVHVAKVQWGRLGRSESV